MTIHLSEAELIDLLNGDVRPAAAELMLQHIDNCERCLTALREFEEFTLLVRKLPRYQIPESLAKQLNAFVDELVAQPAASPSERTSWKECVWARRVIVPATLALLLGLGIWFHGHRRGFRSSEGGLLPHVTTLETQVGMRGQAWGAFSPAPHLAEVFERTNGDVDLSSVPLLLYCVQIPPVVT